MDRTEPFYIEFHPNITSGSSYYYGIRLFAPWGEGWVFDSVEYSLDKANWITVDTSGTWNTKTIIRLDNPADGSRVWLRAKPSGGSWGTSSRRCSISIISSAGRKVNVGGNIMSLIYGGDFTGNEFDFPSDSAYNFKELFSPDVGLGIIEDASQLLLPATTLTPYCYYEMFYYCESLIAAPTITQATIQGGFPYDYMFRACSSLESLTIENTNIRSADYILYGMSPKTIVYKKEGVTTPSNPNKLTVVTLKNTPFNVTNAKFWSINGKKVVKVVDSQNRVIWEDKITPLYKTPFYLEDVSGEANEVRIKMNNSDSYRVPITVEYSYDGENWSTMGTTGVNVTISAPIPANSKIYLRSNTPQWAKGVIGENYIRTTGLFKVGGNIMSLLYGSNFTGRETSFPSGSTYTFSDLFRKCTTIKDASDLLLPATTMVNSCYNAMFFGCTAMVGTPKSLPATTLADDCYAAMFMNCTSLVSIPRVLPANRVYKQSYNTMFADCPLITTAPEIKATTLADQCYFGMFNGCTSLTTAPELPARILADYCYADMFHGCTALTAAPELPARILSQNCYWTMFKGCTNLREIKCLATDVSATDCLKEWVKDVPAGGTFTKKAGVTYPTGNSGIPSGWTVVEV